MSDFTAIKKGDKVVRLFAHGSDAVIYTVTHVTSTRFDAEARGFGLSYPSLRFRKSDGESVGYDSGIYVQPLTEALEEKANETYRMYLASELAPKVKGLSLAGLEKVKAIIEGETNEPHPG